MQIIFRSLSLAPGLSRVLRLKMFLKGPSYFTVILPSKPISSASSGKEKWCWQASAGLHLKAVSDYLIWINLI